MTSRADGMKSPCTGVCTLDGQGRLCVSCGRSIDEIAAWSSMSDAARAGVLARLSAAEAKS